MKKVSVIGAGFAGLTVALQLAKKGFAVDLYEGSSRVGGLLGTESSPYGLAEHAANALIRTEKSDELFRELGLSAHLPLESSKKRFIFRDHPRTWPLRLTETLTLITKVLPRLLRGKKSLQPQKGQTLQEWGTATLGESATRFILGPAMQGIYGNDIHELSASLILGPVFSKKKKSRYKGLLTGRNGMQELIDALEKKLRDLRVTIHLNSKVKVSDVSGPVVIATSASAAGKILEETQPALAQTLQKIRMSSLLSVTLFFDKAQNDYQGFGCLIPRGYGLKSLGVLMNSYIFAHRNKFYNETWILGGAAEESLLDLSDSELLELLHKERLRILGNATAPCHSHIQRWKNALPFYDLTLEKVLEELKSQPLPENLYLHGNYLGGIGLSKILERSHALAEEIASRHG